MSGWKLPHRARVAGWVVAASLALGLGGLTCAGHWPLTRVIRAETFPDDALRCIEANQLEGPLFNSFEWGGYLDWNLPRLKVFIDGRNDVYSGSIYADYLAIIEGRTGWSERLRRYGANLVLVRNDMELPITALLDQSPQWTHVYHDQIADVFMRRAQAEKITVAPLAEENWTAYKLVARAREELVSGDQESARRHLIESIRRDFYYGPAYLLLGMQAAQRGQLEEARDLWERGLELDPQTLLLHYNLGLYYRRHGSPWKARWHFFRELWFQPDFKPAREALNGV